MSRSLDFCRKQFWVCAIAILLVAAGIRLPQAPLRSLWTDELTTLEVIHAHWGQIASERLERGHFPTYFWMLKAWCGVLGESHLALRAPSLLFNLGAILFLMLFMRGWAGNLPALVSGMLFALHQRSIWSAVEARPYAATLFFVVLSYFALLGLARRQSATRIFGYVAASAMAAFLHVTAAPAIGFQLLFVLVTKHSFPAESRRRLIVCTTIAASLAGLAALLPLFLSEGAAEVGEPGLHFAYALDGFAQLFMGEYQYLGGSSLRHIGELMGVWAIVAACVFAARGPANERKMFGLTLFWALSAIVAVPAMNFAGVIGETFRYWVMATPAAVALIALGAALESRAPIRNAFLRYAHRLLIVLSIATVGAVGVGYCFFPGDGVARAVHRIARASTENEIVFAVSGGRHARTIFDYYGPVPPKVFTVNRDITYREALKDVLAEETRGRDAFWVFLYKPEDSPILDCARSFSDRFKEKSKFETDEVRVYYFERVEGR